MNDVKVDTTVKTEIRLCYINAFDEEMWMVRDPYSDLGQHDYRELLNRDWVRNVRWERVNIITTTTREKIEVH